ncbi:MAG: CHAT domain-containing protein [Proteobacteria bacterium]|nr:CHAT domain-containing protein [Pseudomonadota bacterium]
MHRPIAYSIRLAVLVLLVLAAGTLRLAGAEALLPMPQLAAGDAAGSVAPSPASPAPVRKTSPPPASPVPQPEASSPAAPLMAPPRTIADITEILDKQKPDPAKRAANFAAADKEPPKGLEPAALADFYFQRGLAAGEIGRSQQRLADLKQASELGKRANIAPALLGAYLQQLTGALQGAGDTRAALELVDERLRLMAQSQQLTALFGLYAQKISLALTLGQLAMASDAMAQAEAFMGTYSNLQRVPTHMRDAARTTLLSARAQIAQDTGRYAEAEATLREALSLFTKNVLPNEGQFPVAPGTFADARDRYLNGLTLSLMSQGRLIEAEAESRRSLLGRLERRGRYAAESATEILLLAQVLYEQGRYAEAERLADAARDILENLGHGKGSGFLANTRRWIAQSQSAAGKHEATQATYAALERDIGDEPGLRRKFLDGNINYGLVLLRSNRSEEAIRIIQNVAEQNAKRLGEKAYATAEARGWLGAALVRAGQNDRALKEFLMALPILTSASREANDNSEAGGSIAERDRRAQKIIEAYLGLLADSKGAAAAAETFHLAEAVRGRSVERALAASAARGAASDPALAELVRREQDAQKQIAALQGMLTNVLSLPTNEQDQAAVQKLREQIDQLRDARARLREEIERSFPDYVNLIDPRPATIEQAQKSLRPGEALIATYAGEERLFVWAIPQQGSAAFAAAKVGDREIASMVSELRKALDPNASSLEEVPEFDLAMAYKLYELILKPIETGWGKAEGLMFVPHKALGQLPMALLVTEPIKLPAKTKLPFAHYKAVPFLVRKVAVTQLPSVASLATLRSLPPPKGARIAFIGFGDPWFSPEQAEQALAEANPGPLKTRGAPKTAQLQTRGIPLVRRSAPATQGVNSAELAMLPRLPDTAEEVRNIALALNADLTKDVILGAAANEKTVRSMNLADRRIIVFATHGLVPGDLNGLTQPALALSSPAVAKIDGDGLLTMEKILGLKLNADWVVLSACNTATAAGAGAEAVSGLGRAFFYAGTRALLVSNWPVETSSAKTLTTDLFRRQAEKAGLGRGEAMRQAELALIDGPGYLDPESKAPLFSYAHPIFWAPFTVVGDGGSTL